jgi:uncharacterized damage-inducible protein DinB
MFTAEQAQGLAAFLIQGYENEVPLTKKVLAALPEDQKDFKLGDKGRTAMELAWHLVTSDLWFLDSIAAGAFSQSEDGGRTKPGTVKELVSM